MGNSPSSHDYDSQLMTYQANFTKVVFPADGALGPAYAHRSLEGEVNKGCVLEDGKKVMTLWDAFSVGMETSGAEAGFLATRAYKVQEGEYTRTPEETGALPGNYKPSGYVERSNGTVDRFEFVTETYQEVYNNVCALGRALRAVGLNKGDNVGIFSINRSEWLQTGFGIYSQGMRVVSIYATLGANAVEYIVNHAETSVVFVSLQNFNALAKTFAQTQSNIKHVVLYDDIGRYGNALDKVTDAQKAKCQEFGVTCWGFSEFIAHGHANAQFEFATPDVDDLAYIMYTSGTTGNPKGALLTHGNIMSAIDSLKSHIKPKPHRFASYLPLAHIFEMVSVAFNILCGSTIYFCQGDVRYIVQDLQEIKPTFLPGVPRVFLKFYQNIWGQVEKRSCIAKWFIKKSYEKQTACLRALKPLEDGPDKKVFAVMREKIGLQNLEVSVTGSAPCPTYLTEFMKILIGPQGCFYQAYGLTEACAAQSATMMEDPTIGGIGCPFVNNLYALLDVPDMGYLNSNNPPTGELLVYGHNIFKGYYKEETMSKECFYTDSTGRQWLRTGDVARYNVGPGTFSIISRVKSLCKLAQGEYVSLEKVEDAYSKSSILSQVWCYGNSYKPVMVGVVIPAAVPLYEFCVEKGWWNKSVAAPIPGSITTAVTEECQRLIKEKNAEIKAHIKSTLKAFETELLGFEKMKDFIIDCDYDVLGQVFNEERETMTPTSKKRRNQLTEAYLEQLKALYTGLGEPPRDGEKW